MAPELEQEELVVEALVWKQEALVGEVLVWKQEELVGVRML